MKRTIALLLALSFLLLCTVACASKSSSGYGAAPAADTPMEMGAPQFMSYDAEEYAVTAESVDNTAVPAEGSHADADTRKIVYNADLDMTVDDPAAAQTAILERAEALGGYVADSYTTNDDIGAVRVSATIKVPADRLTELATAAKALGKVNDYRLSSDDITMQYYDIDARLKSAKAEEEQLLSILADCHTVEDILAVRESLARVRSDIESYQGQINVWDNLTSYATLSLSISRTPQPEVAKEKDLLTIWKASDVWNRMSRGFVNSARFIVNALSAVGIFLAIAIIPATVLFLVVVLPIILVKKRKRARAAADGEPIPPTARDRRLAKKQAKHAEKSAHEAENPKA